MITKMVMIKLVLTNLLEGAQLSQIGGLLVMIITKTLVSLSLLSPNTL